MTIKDRDCLYILKNLADDNCLSSMQISASILDCSIDMFGNRNLTDLIYDIVRKQPSMAAVINIGLKIIDAVKSGQKNDIMQLKDSVLLSSEKAAIEASKFLSGVKSITTISFSQNVLDVLNKIKPKEVYLSLSRPAKEGEMLAVKLKDNSIKPVLFEDNAYSLVLKNTEAVLVGADAIFDYSFVNKTGTLSLALLSREFGIPFYVVGCSCKYLDKDKRRHFKILSKPGSEISDINCKKINMYFEEIPIKLVNKMFVR